MSYDSYPSDSSVRAVIDRFGFSHLLATTVVLVAATILLGVATRAAGAGLACNANWPLCDGGLLDAFPASFPSFFEWIHRVVAMIAGFFIVGTAVVAWRGAVERRLVRIALTAGMVLTPIQVYLGRETVLGYDLPILTLHFWTAIVIFVLFVGSAFLLWAHAVSDAQVTYSLAIGATLVPIHVALSPVLIGRYTPVVQTMQYATTLGLLVAICLVGIVGWHRREGGAIGAGIGTVVPAVGVVAIVFGREAVSNPGLEGPYLLISAALCAALAVGAIFSFRARSPGSAARSN